MEYNLDNFKRGLDELGIVLDEVQIGQFLTYYELLTEKNKVMNLTAITEFQEVVEKHFLDSLSLVKGAGIFRSEFQEKIFQRLAFSKQSAFGLGNRCGLSRYTFKNCVSKAGCRSNGFSE